MKEKLELNELDENDFYVCFDGLIFRVLDGEIYIETSKGYLKVNKNEYADKIFKIYNE